MKKLNVILLVLAVSFSFLASAQKFNESDIKISSLMKHYQNYPHVENTKWYQLDNDLIQANFEFEGLRKVVTYTNRMKVVQEWTEVKDIPNEVNTQLALQYADFKLLNVFKVDDRRNGTTFYSIETKVKKVGTVFHSFDMTFQNIDHEVTLMAILD